jgi:hypothetical protein
LLRIATGLPDAHARSGGVLKLGPQRPYRASPMQQRLNRDEFRRWAEAERSPKAR